ncbi:MaoC family dehydratase N-terminal domain-containing protein [Bosea sp. (in: a-proteobacteria)]|uniref:MaoC family dehydratase N-terminal domain-containing protein n=1 Tax=Bosea sp. (in: a-proteobacteria) TaxID=1871050 RepID=UPI002628EED7|nr:MaoC family dehydratase N-terminal domain-containing protein [Bosea sp. (in: a-proteobacteria)]MCO5090919.1 MaoC family dehydratase N-terminal domain-containing protein [Bosea sp. (in: a-proteobacteria)]
MPRPSPLAVRVSAQIGRVFPAHDAVVDAGHIARFAHAIGETRPVYFEEAAARAAGYETIPAPPTFLFTLSIMKPRPFDIYDELGIEQAAILHAGQSFRIISPILAGRKLTFLPRLSGAVEKSRGALLFVSVETSVTDAEHRLVALLTTTVAARQGAGS